MSDGGVNEMGVVLHGHNLDCGAFRSGVGDGGGAPKDDESEGESDKLEVHDLCGIR